jgi:hypothetical protein
METEVIRLTANGVWMSDQTEIDHQNTVQLFFRSIHQDDEGYFLKVGFETKRIIVEDTAYFVMGLEGSAAQGYLLILSDGAREPLDPSTLKYQLGRLTCRVHGARFEAKFLQKSYVELLQNLQQDGDEYFLEVAGQRVSLARVDRSICG